MANPVPGVPLSSVFNSALSRVPMQNRLTGRDPNAQGVHSSWPFMTPKYARWVKNRHHEFEDTMARMFIKIPPGDYEKFLASLDDPETATIAKYLTGDDVKQGGVGYIDFFLQSAQHQLIEKVQVTETLSDNYVAFFFGTQAPTFQYQGTLMNTYQDDWTMRMYRIFRDLARGTQLARRGLILYMRYDSMIVSGAMTDFNWKLDAGRETFCDFSFSLLVKNLYIVYGGSAPPTKVQDHFAPAGFVLENTNGGASQTYIGGPPSRPEGVSYSAQQVMGDAWAQEVAGEQLSAAPPEWEQDVLNADNAR